MWGIPYVPRLSDAFSYCFDSPILPSVVPRLEDIPSNTTLFAMAPFVDSECGSVISHQAHLDGARMVMLVNDSLTNNGFMVTGNAEITIMGLSNSTGGQVFSHMSDYVSNNTVVPSSGGPLSIERIGVFVGTSYSPNLPRIWIYVLAVLAGVILLFALLSMCLNVTMVMRRRSLRRRILAGEVNLELLGVKRLLVPQEVLDKIPVRVYTHGEQHFSPSETASMPEHVKSKLFSRTRSSSVTAASIQSTEETDSGKINGYFQTECPICLEDFVPNETNVRELPCKHIYHLECIDPFLKKQSSLCPLCKTSTLPKGYLPHTLRITNATVRREREMRRRAQTLAANQGEPAGIELASQPAVPRPLATVQERQEAEVPTGAVSSANDETRAEIEAVQPNNVVNGRSEIQPATPGLEALALTQEEEAAAFNRMPTWRRVIGHIFPSL